MTVADCPLVTTCLCGAHVAGPVLPPAAERYAMVGECGPCADLRRLAEAQTCPRRQVAARAAKTYAAARVAVASACTCQS